ncbi:MAG: (Fe-S)-binding protein [Candidatus Binatia bacterium]
MAQSAKQTTDFVEFEKFLDCVHCGFCLPACPTYLELGTEMDSPRGRIHLMRSLYEGRVPLDAASVKHLDLCLGCRACEDACPSGVAYGDLIEAARPFLENFYHRSLPDRLKRGLIKKIFPNPLLARAFAAALKLGGALGLEKAAGMSSLPSRLRYSLALLPGRELTRGKARLPERAPPQGEPRFRVGLLSGCVMQNLFGRTQENTVRLLSACGCEVFTPKEQVCCGALSLHNGDEATAVELALENVAVFGSLDLDAIIVNAAGCGAMMREYGKLLKRDKEARKATEIGAKVRDVSEFLAAVPDLKPKRRLEVKATYHDACHLLHAQKVRQQPRALIEQIPGLVLTELPESEICCGSAGTYNLTEPGMAQRLLERKIKNIAATGTDLVVTGNPGCLLQIQAGLRMNRLPIKVIHTVDLLAQAYL